MDILVKLGLMFFWFFVVVAAGTLYVWVIIFLIKKGIIGDTAAKIVYFATFVIIASIVYKLPLFS